MANEKKAAEQAKEVQTKWLQHRNNYQLHLCRTSDGAPGVILIDITTAPGHFYVFAFGEKSYRGLKFLLEEEEKGAHIFENHKKIFDDAISGTRPSEIVTFNEAINFLGLDGRPIAGIAELSLRNFARTIGNEKLIAKLPRDGLISSEMKRMTASGLSDIISSINQDAIKAISSADNVKWRDYAYYSAPGELGEIRRQAAKYFHVLASLMVERFSIKRAIDAQLDEKKKTEAFLASDEYKKKLESVETRGDVSATVLEWMKKDGREPYPPWLLSEKAVRLAIQNSIGTRPDGQPIIPMHVFNNLRGLEWPTNGVPIEAILYSLAELPPDWFPKSREEWDAFCDLTDTVTKILSKVSGQVSPSGTIETIPLKTLYDGCSGKWVAYKERFMRTYADQRPPEGVTAEDYAIIEKSTDWKGLTEIDETKLRAAAIETVEQMAGLSNGCPRDELAAWIYKKIRPDLSRQALHNACFEVEEMLDTFARKIILPLAANEAAKSSGRSGFNISEQHNITARMSAARILIGSKSATRMMEMVRVYINHASEIAGAGQPEDDETKRSTEEDRRDFSRQHTMLLSMGINPEDTHPGSWAPLCPVVKAPNDVFVVPLTSPKMLEDEGRSRSGSAINSDGSHGLRICVGEKQMPYAKNCQMHGAHILSLRKKGGNDGVPYTRLSCIQIDPITSNPDSPNAKILKVVQHRGFENGTPPEEALAALKWFLTEVAAGRIPLNYDGIRNRLGMFRAKKIDEIVLMCSYDWRDANLIAVALQPWGSLVGKKVKKMSIEEFGKEPEIVAVTNALAPTLESVSTPQPKM